MTMKAMIVNASNWEGEAIAVDHGDGNPVVTLAPGEMTEVHVGHGNPDPIVTLRDMSAKVTKPFELNGQQVFPEVQTTIGRTKVSNR